MITYHPIIDGNGNSAVQVRIPKARSFSIQSNGNLPMTHRFGIGDWTDAEVASYVYKYGTKRQKDLIDHNLP